MAQSTSETMFQGDGRERTILALTPAILQTMATMASSRDLGARGVARDCLLLRQAVVLQQLRLATAASKSSMFDAGTKREMAMAISQHAGDQTQRKASGSTNSATAASASNGSLDQ